MPAAPGLEELWVAARATLGHLVERHGATTHGVTVDLPGRWQTAAGHEIPIDIGPARGSARPRRPTCRLAHDEREAPVCLGDDGTWDDSLLVSLSDEGAVALCAWLEAPERTPIAGIGVDLATRGDFAGERGATFNHLLFTEHEQGLVDEICPHDHALGCAFAFSAKEAAFKACAAPLRAWYARHDQELVFDLRSFQLDDADHEVGTARRGEAQQALDAMGIERIELARTSVGDLALTFAIALREGA